MRTRTFFRYALLAFASAAVACGVHQQETPSLTGPSQFALSVSVTALPDSINQDGGSQSSIRVLVHDANGQPLAGQSIRLDMEVVNALGVLVPTDFGTLSARTVVTASDGTAFVTYTAPPAPPNGATIGTCRTFNTPGTLPGQCVTITATPIGSDFGSSQTQSVEIRLVVPGVILPPGQTPVVSFVVSPTPVSLNVPALFDASASCAGPLVNGACNPSTAPTVSISQYAWTFGDGGTASGKTASHTYSTAGTFTATLTVTNSAGLAASATQQITVGASTPPTAVFVFSPDPPVANAVTNFNADGSRAAPGHTIVQVSWDFGDGTGASGTFATHTYTAAATYAVVLTVLDDAGQKTTISQNVIVVTGNPVPLFTVSPTSPTHNVSATFNASGTTTSGGATVSTYTWAWGDGTANNTDGTGVVTQTHTFTSVGSFTVTLTVTDSQTRIGVFSALVVVQ